MVQAEYVRARLAAIMPGAALEIVAIRTSGDKMANASLASVGGKGLFIHELEQALAGGTIDLAVHSMKDLPARMAPGFRIAAIPPREDVRDILVSIAGTDLAAMRPRARIGTSSIRRRLQALRKNPALEVLPLRGNVDTRLKKVAGGALDAIIIAAAGLNRLGRAAEVKFTILDERDFIPAGGQAALAIETRVDGDSAELAHALGAIDDRRARLETSAERACLATLGASCVTPIGVHGSLESGSLTLRAILFSTDGARELADSSDQPLAAGVAAPDAVRTAEAAGVRLAERMLARGAKALIGDE